VPWDHRTVCDLSVTLSGYDPLDIDLGLVWVGIDEAAPSLMVLKLPETAQGLVVARG
jgi:hypothetical protein